MQGVMDLVNQDKMSHDAVVGGVVGGVSAGFQGIIRGSGTPASEYLGRQLQVGYIQLHKL